MSSRPVRTFPPSSRAFLWRSQTSFRPTQITCQWVPAIISFFRSGTHSGLAGWPLATPMTNEMCGSPSNMPAFLYRATLRTIPESKHSNSGTTSSAAMASRKACTFSTGLSQAMGGQAQVPSLLSLKMVPRSSVAPPERVVPDYKWKQNVSPGFSLLSHD